MEHPRSFKQQKIKKEKEKGKKFRKGLKEVQWAQKMAPFWMLEKGENIQFQRKGKKLWVIGALPVEGSC